MLVEATDRDIGAAAEVLFNRQIQRIGHQRAQLGIANATRPGRTGDASTGDIVGSVEAVANARVQLIHAGASQHAGRAKAQQGLRSDFVRDVQARQEVGVLRAIGDRLRDRTRTRVRSGEAISLLVGVNHLDTRVTAQRAVVEVGLDVTGQDLFTHGEAVGQAARRPQRFAGQLVVAFVVVAPGIERDHARDADEAKADRLVQVAGRNGGAGRVRLVGQHIAFVDQLLAAIRIVRADSDVFNEAVQRLDSLETDRLQAILDRRTVNEAVLAVRHGATAAVPALRVGDREQGRVGIVDGRLEADHAAFGRHGEAQAVGCADAAATAGAEVDFKVLFGLLQTRIAEVQLKGQRVVGLERGVVANRPDLGIAVDDVVAHHRLDAVEAARGDQTTRSGVARLERGSRPLQRQFDAAQALFVVELRPVAIEGGVDAIVRLEFQHAHQAITLQFVRLHVRLGAADHLGGRIEVRIAPGVPALFLGRRLHAGIAEGPADRAIGILIDVEDVGAIALVRDVRVQLAQVVQFGAGANHDLLLAIGDRTDRLHVDRATQGLADQLGIGGLVDHGAVQQFGRVLVQFNAAVVAGADLLAAVQQRGGEVRRKAADRNDVGAAIKALGGQARQARQRFSDRQVGQLAQIFGRNNFNDRAVRLLLRRR